MYHLLSPLAMTLEKQAPWVSPEAPHLLLRQCSQVGKLSHRQVKPETSERNMMRLYRGAYGSSERRYNLLRSHSF